MVQHLHCKIRIVFFIIYVVTIDIIPFVKDNFGLNGVNGEHSLIMLVYNIKRSINILGVPDLIAKIKSWNAKYPTKGFVAIKRAYLKLFYSSIENKTAIAA
jgi:hypothetical protein